MRASSERACARYGAVADEYIERLGHLEQMSPIDRATIETWAFEACGPLLDAGCGPGHWTKAIHDLGIEIEGIDAVPELIASASSRFPDVGFQLGDLEDLAFETGRFAGILAWYSLIHFEPPEFRAVLSELARCLRPGATLVLGFFVGDRLEQFDHAVTAAYRWPLDDVARALDSAGFVLLGSRTRHDPGAQPHGEVLARRR